MAFLILYFLFHKAETCVTKCPFGDTLLFLPKCNFSESAWFPYKCVLFLLIFPVDISDLVAVLGLSALLQRVFYGLVKENNKFSVCQAVLEAWGAASWWGERKKQQPKTSKLLKISAAKGSPSGSWLSVPSHLTGLCSCSCPALASLGVHGGIWRAGTIFLPPVASELPDCPLQRLLWFRGKGG